jgi:hypothetical protein
VRYMGGMFIDPSVHDGRLRPAIGVESREVMRANRTHPDQADGFGWTYNHAPMLAYWGGRFYLEYLSNPVGEHIAPGQTLVATSADGRSWTMPQVVFPPYKLREGGPGMMHQRMGFYVAPNQRLLVLAFYAYAPNPFGKGGIGRVVREAYRDGTYGPIHFIRYNSWVGWNESNTNYPLYTKSSDRGFVEACEALLKDKLKTMQWWEEDRSQDGFYTVAADLEAPSVYHRKDGLAVALWKWSHGALSTDEGKSWTQPVKLPTLLMDGAKVWGQRTRDGRYALVYNPINDTNNRWPLAVVTGDDGIHFDHMLLVNGEVPPKRHIGLWKDWGSMYVRGISEGNGVPPGEDLWVTYSVTKEDIWVSRIPLPVRESVDRPVHDTFDQMAPGAAVADWNIYSPKWAPVAVAAFPSAANRSLELQDRDPYNYAKALRVFPESRTVDLSFKLFSRQADAGDLEVEVLDRYGNRPVRFRFADDGRIKAISGGREVDVAAYSPNTWSTVGLAVRTKEGNYTLSIDGKPVLTRAPFAEAVYTVERLSFRTGPYRTEPTRSMDPEKVPADLPNADEPERNAVYYLDDVTVTPGASRDAKR